MRLIAATLDPATLKPESTWYLATSLPLAQVSAEQVYEIYRLRDWIEHYYKPVKHELGWADYQLRPERAIVRHWQLVHAGLHLQFAGGGRAPRRRARHRPSPPTHPRSATGGGKIRASGRPRRGSAVVWAATLRRVRSWLCPWAQLQRYLEALVDAPPHRPSWPRSSPTSPSLARLRPRLDQPATK